MTGTDGIVGENYKYSPWGELTIFNASGEQIADPNTENPYLFTGREVDISDGVMLKLQINRHRILNYPLARWMQAAPVVLFVSFRQG